MPTGVQREIEYKRGNEVNTHFIVSPIAEADEIPVAPVLPSLVSTPEEDTIAAVTAAAAAYRVSAHEMIETIRCETGNTFDPGLQSYVVRNGEREDSWGLAQIHLPSHPEITRDDATDPTFAINFMASEFSKGNQWKWACWKLLAWQGAI